MFHVDLTETTSYLPNFVSKRLGQSAKGLVAMLGASERTLRLSMPRIIALAGEDSVSYFRQTKLNTIHLGSRLFVILQLDTKLYSRL
jgi:hypothetical protein